MPTYLLEVGCEELPADFVDSALEQWKARIPPSLDEQLLTPEAIEVYGTPRRLALLIRGLPSGQPNREEEIKGPPAQVAFQEGEPTKAAQGFARKQGVALEELEVRATEKGEFVFIQKSIPGRSATEILQELTPSWILGLEGKRFMRWGDGDLRFSRPIRWLVTLLDDAVLPIELVNGSETIKGDRYSLGDRVLHPQPVEINHAADYVDTLDRASVTVNPEQRRTEIAAEVKRQAQNQGGYAGITQELLAEVTNLVELPSVLMGKFDAEFLNLPPEAIATVMIDHQRYFPVWKSEDATELLPYFITASNGDPAKADIITAGNERVIRARLSDGQFFYNVDLAKPLESYVSQLDNVTFQESLGSVGAKVERIRSVAHLVGKQLQVSEEEDTLIQRAALLCKADLVTQMVGEFPELQGIMGEKYALASGEPEAVATAISQHYLPRGSGDSLPSSLVAQVVGIADRLDTLVSIFGLGMLPTGSSDPFALRRAANAVITITWAKSLPLNLQQLLQQVVANFVATFSNSEADSTLLQQLQDFFLQRIRTLLEEQGIDYDLINAVVGENDPEYAQRALSDLLDLQARAQFLQHIRKNGTLDSIYETVNRSTRLAGKGDLDTQQLDPSAVVRPELFEQSSEQSFYDALVELIPQTRTSQAQRNYQMLVDALAKVAPTVSNFFDGSDSVLVMAENPEIRQNRLNLLGLLRNHARALADFGRIVKK